MSRAALLDAIRANPAEDLPRLLYADWLEEFGGSDLDRATVEFVRLSCDLRPGGRYVKAGVRFALPGRLYSLELECHRGFVERVAYCSFTLMRAIKPAVEADQPLARW